ncbi:MAG: signal peptidase I [Methanobacteriaceae archaeon]|nr:signal peptidase I [Methanobacteriaceae archaeon]
MADDNQIKEIAIYLAIIIIGVIAAQHMNVVVSGSMEPVFYRGDIVLVEKANFLGIHEFNPEDVKKGDIVIYNANWFPDPVIHRVVATGTAKNGTKYYIIKGDNNPIPDPAVAYPSQITARVITIGNQPIFIPRIGYITLWIRGL